MTTEQPIAATLLQIFSDSVATALNAAGIPCLLWNHYLWQAHGICVLVPSVDFVIPDGSVEAAKEVMTTSHFSKSVDACPDTTKCSEGNAPDRKYPHPSFHMHSNGRGVGFYVQSETLWFLPPLDATLANPKANPLPPYLAFACDRTALPPGAPGIGMGTFDSDETVVLVLKAHILTEALMRIMAAHAGKIIGTYAIQHFCYIEEFVEGRGFLDIDLLPRPLADFYRAFKDNPAFGLVLKELQRALEVPVRPVDH
ncbi:thioredoxin reductase [Chaetomium tenue]|uniref:Thioredoxin reductase n=1 Tax=Chaetomium tenue TaxID=1854479 RepID=A0ACB7P9G0_9PEZI|nr:thioredoxin reductase [Chaetomium globosum]